MFSRTRHIRTAASAQLLDNSQTVSYYMFKRAHRGMTTITFDSNTLWQLDFNRNRPPTLSVMQDSTFQCFAEPYHFSSKSLKLSQGHDPTQLSLHVDAA
eukprot:5704846-Amphidinium_carterae.1